VDYNLQPGLENCFDINLVLTFLNLKSHQESSATAKMTARMHDALIALYTMGK